MKLTNIRPVGRYINPETGKPVNVKRGRNAGRSTDHLFYLYMGKRAFIADSDFSGWKKAGADLSDTQLAVLKECCKYSISEDRGKYYRLGGSGHAPIRYNRKTLLILKQKGLVEYKGYWTATDAGRKLVASKAEKSA